MDKSDRRFALLQSVGAYAVYQAVSILLFGLPLLHNFTGVYAGSGPDPQFMLWSVAWWPYALSHHLNPLHTNLIWAPAGFDLTWSTSNLLQGLVVAPITIRFGPIAGLNVLQLMMPAMSAWAGYVLIREITRRVWPALLGGYLYGFSPFIIGHQMGAHLFASGAFLPPLMVLLTLKHLNGRLGSRAFVALFVITLIAQFLMGLELLASAGIFGTVAMIAAWLAWRERRPDLLRATKLILASIAIAVAVLVPLLVPMLRASGMGRHRVWSDHGVDLLELIVPDRNFLLGSMLEFGGHSISSGHFARDLGGYVGLPLLIMLALFFARSPSGERKWFLAAMLAITYIAALGPTLHIGDRSLVTMPWRLFDRLPFINSAQAARFTVIVDLLIAIIVAIEFAALRLHALGKSVLAAIIVVSVLPNFLDDSLWVIDPKMPRFLTSGAFKHDLRPGENVLVLPFGAKGQAMAWQTLSDMYFRMPEGWTGPTPPSFAAWPIMDVFNFGVDIPEKQLQMDAFVAAHDVTAIIIDSRPPEFARGLDLLDRGQFQIKDTDDVVLARPSSAISDSMRQVSATEMHCRMDEARLQALTEAATKYLQAGYQLDHLTPRIAEDRGFLPAHWVETKDKGTFTHAGFGLGPAGDGRVMIGVTTPGQCVANLVDRHHDLTSEILFPAPHRWGTKRRDPSREGKLVFVVMPGKLRQLSSQ